MKTIVGSERDPLAFCCELAADESKDAQLRLSAASIALPYLYPRLSATQVAATHTTVKVDATELAHRLNAQIARLAPALTTQVAETISAQQSPESVAAQ